MDERSYAVFWVDGSGLRYAGCMALRPACAELSGCAHGGRRSFHRVSFDEISSVGYERGHLHLHRKAAPSIHIGSVDRPGALRELADRLQAAVLPA